MSELQASTQELHPLNSFAECWELFGTGGPDSSGLFTGSQVALASTRLSIIDPNTGDQPIHNEDESIWVVLNGEIFNYPELRELAKSRGHRFYTGTDTEVLVHLYEDEGPHLLDRLNGQFALAIWDVRRQELLLGRDRMGIRPLFYHLNNGRLVFASEIKALFVDTSVPRRMNSKTLGDIFTGGHRINPQEIEDVIFRSDFIIEVAVLGIPDNLLGHKLIAIVAPKNGSCKASHILNFCAGNLPKYKVPSNVNIVRALPKSSNGKIDRNKCIKLLES